MKIHRNLCQAITSGLKEILLDKKQADITVGNLLQSNKSWGARDRHFIAENIYAIVRYKRLFEFCLNREILNEATLWQMLEIKFILENTEIPAWEEFIQLKKEEIFKRYEIAKSIRKIRESIPDWLDERGEKELKEKWEEEIVALNSPARFSIRVNTIKTNKEVLKKLFINDNIPFLETKIAPNALIILSKKNFKNYLPFKNGLFEIQDVSSQLVAPFLEVKPAMKVIDGCAGAGGKSLHLAALMQNKGEILSVDINEKKLKELEKRASRAGSNIIKPFCSKNISLNFTNHADRVLIDVPCSGLGVLRRKPDAKWNLTEKFMDELLLTQAQILDKYSVMLKKTGILVYSTCSILHSENELQIKKFLERNKNFILIDEIKISPAETGFDGFYMAKLKRI